MMDHLDGLDPLDNELARRARFALARLPASLKAALIFAIPFIVIDFFNYYSAGTALVLSAPLLMGLYVGCGALGAKLSASGDGRSSNFILTGALASILLWLASTVINTLVSLIIGTATLGTTLLLGAPYLCLCAPIELVGGGLLGALGGFIYGLLHKEAGIENFYG